MADVVVVVVVLVTVTVCDMAGVVEYSKNKIHRYFSFSSENIVVTDIGGTSQSKNVKTIFLVHGHTNQGKQTCGWR